MYPKLEVMIGQKLRELRWVRRFRTAVRDCRATQEEKLLSIIRANEESAFGRKHRFASIRCLKDFQEQVPASSYEDLFPYIEAAMNGSERQLTVERPVMFATTSGTTDKPKFIPVTRSHLRDYIQAFQIHNYQMIADYPRGAIGKFLIITSNDEQGRTPGGTPFGAVSGMLNRTQPAIIKKYFALPYELCKITDVDTKYYLMLRIAAAQDVTALVCCNPSSLLLLCDQLRDHTSSLIEDIYQGRIASSHRPPAALSDAFAPYLQPNRTAARRLNTLLEKKGSLLPSDLWPDLSIISCWKGGPMSFYLDKLDQLFAGVPIRDFGYMASEGRGSIPLTNEGAGGVLAVTSHFFEFVNETQSSHSNPDFLTADQLTLGERYYIYFTTAAGLYRYNINDLVEVVGFHEQTPIIQFVRKGAGVSSITGEKITEEQVHIALVQTAQQLGLAAQINHFTAAVQLCSPPYYGCFIELAGSLAGSVQEEFVRKFDSCLMAVNTEYEDKRRSRRLDAPQLHILAPGSYTAMRQQRVAEGAPEAQVKIPLLAQQGEFQLNQVGQLL